MVGVLYIIESHDSYKKYKYRPKSEESHFSHIKD